MSECRIGTPNCFVAGPHRKTNCYVMESEVQLCQVCDKPTEDGDVCVECLLSVNIGKQEVADGKVTYYDA